jgi:hypothetical protein
MLALLLSAALGGPASAAQGAGAPSGPAPVRPAGCLADGGGYFRARIRGAMNVDLDWRNSELECEGGARLAGGGMRLSFAGPLPRTGRRLRLVLGVSELGARARDRAGTGPEAPVVARTARGGASVAIWHALPTNLTVIVEGGQRVFATRGDDKCTIDSLRLEPLRGADGAAHTYRAVARGFCTAPASGITRNERIVVTRFDFAGRIVLERATLSSPPR